MIPANNNAYPDHHPDVIRQRWRNSGFQRTSEMTRGWTGEGTARNNVPKFEDGTPVCLNWAIKGVCDRNCTREGAHRESNSAMVNKLMQFMDKCGVARN